MEYKVHKLDVNRKNMQEVLQKFLNKIDGEIISIVPNVRPTFQPMGATSKTDYLLVVERVA